MTLPKRARRRQDRQRMVAKALRIFRCAHGGNYPSVRRPHDYKALADNLAHCSKACCRNPRRTSKGIDRLPWQEVRALQRLVSNVVDTPLTFRHQGQGMSVHAFTGGDL